LGWKVANEKSATCGKIVALLGAPNVGKTTLFNVLTGSTELVANWPGATVSVRYVKRRFDGIEACIVDLPGTYSIHGTGPEERVTREFIISNRVDLLLVLVDSTNIERGLFLALDALELTPRVAIVLTKIDDAMSRGINIDVDKLASELGVPVVAVSAVKNIGIDKLIGLVKEALEGSKKWDPRVGVIVPKEIRDLHSRLASELEHAGLEKRLAEWLAARLLEGAGWAEELLRKLLPQHAERILRLVTELRAEAERRGVDLATAFVAAKYELASRLRLEVVQETQPASPGLSRIDAIFLHPLLGPLAGFAMMFLVFFITYAVTTGSPIDMILDWLGFHRAAELVAEYSLMNLVAAAMDRIAETVMSIIPHPVIAKMIGEGVLSSSYGLGLVMSFMPLVAVLMFLIGVLEDSGLVPRIAAGVDKLFRRFGVSGKAVFPAMLSLGCNVPGVLAARVMDSEVERRAVVFAVPLIPCMARFTVLLAFAHVFFPGSLSSSVVVFTVYVIAVTLFLLTLKLARRLMGGEEEEEFVLELPPLKKPSLRVVWWLTWDKLKHFLIRAGTVIVTFSIILWLLANYGPEGYLGGTSPEKSYAAMLGKAMEPYISAVFGVTKDIAWRLGFGFISGFVAKEVFLDALAAVAPGGGGLEAYPLTPAQALAVMVAATLYIPCVATLSAMYSETRSGKLVVAAFIYDMALASVAALAVRLAASLPW